MPFKLSDTASIAQLAFGLNAVMPVLTGHFRSAHTCVAETVEKEVKKHHPDFTVNASDKKAFAEMANSSVYGVKMADKIRPWIFFAACASSLSSFSILVAAATHPDIEFPNIFIFIYATVTVILLPMLYFAWGLFLKFLINKIANSEISKEKTDAYILAFSLKKDTDKIKESMNDFYLYMYKMKLLNFRRNIRKIKILIQDIITFRWISKWRHRRMVDKILRDYGGNDSNV